MLLCCFITGSDDDDDEAISGFHEPILEAKDPYALRPMPYLIGTAGVFESEDVGIGEFGSESTYIRKFWRGKILVNRLT